MCDIAHSYVWHGSFIRVTWLIHMCNGSFIRDVAHSSVTWLIHMWHGSFIRVTWLIHMCNGSFICDMAHSSVTWLIHMWHGSFMCHLTHFYVWHDSFICGTWLKSICDMTHSYVQYDLFTCATCVFWAARMDVDLCTHKCVRAGIFVCGVGWLERLPAQELRNHTVAEHACSKMSVLCFTKTKWGQW